MKKSTPLLALWLVSLLAAATAGSIPVVSPAEARLSATELAKVDRFMTKAVADKKMAGGVVIVAHDGKVGFFHAYGLADREAKQPMATNTIFRLYSMSKAITTAAALTLYDAGKLDLDAPVSKYIPGFADQQVATTNGLRAPTRPVTIRDLMRHTSGLTYDGGPPAVQAAYDRLKPLESTNIAEMAGKLSQVPLAFDPGTDWAYSTGLDVLGRVIEVVSGERLDVFLGKTIFTPLGMSDTAFSVPPEKLNRFAALYSRTNGLTVTTDPFGFKFTPQTTLFSGGGGLVGTAEDYLRFLSMIAQGGVWDGHRILRAETVQLMTSNQLPDAAFPIHFGKDKLPGIGYGLGFSVRTELAAGNPGRVGEYGWGGAASTHYWTSPADKLIVITLEQIMPYETDTELGVKKFIYDAVNK